MQAVLELLAVPYVGTPARACRRAWDKPTAKAELARAGLDDARLGRAAAHHLPGARRPAVLDAMVDRLGLPLMLKPDQGGSALGAQVVGSRAELPAAMVSCLAYADTVLAEQFVDGVEVAVTVVEDEGTAARAARRRGGGEGRRLRLHRPLHARCGVLPQPGAASTPRPPPQLADAASAAHRSSGCATSPASMPWWTPRVASRSSRSTSRPD